MLTFAAIGHGDTAGELFSILDPINHASTRAGVHRYKVEPYVIAPNVDTEPRTSAAAAGPGTRARRAGCTRPASRGSSGFRLRGTTLLVDPCIPRAWPGYEIDFRYRSARYEIVVENPQGVSRGVAFVELDGQPLAGAGAAIPLADDGATHRVRVILG